MSDVVIKIDGASEFEQRELQTLIKIINPNALPKYGIDGEFGREGLNDLQKILAEHAPMVSGEMSVKDAIESLKVIAQYQTQEAHLSDKPLSEITKDQGKYIQNLINIIDPKLMPEKDIDGIVGRGTKADLKKLLPEEMVKRFDELTTDEIVQELQTQIADMPPRHIVQSCENLTVIARKVYADDIKEYTKQLMESGVDEYATEKAARAHAERIAVTKIAFENNLEKGADANLIHENQQLVIPTSGPLKDVDGTLDWKALGAKVGPGGPCGCEGGDPTKNIDKGDFKKMFGHRSGGSTKSSQPPPNPTLLSKLEPNTTVKIGDNCLAVLRKMRTGFLWTGPIKEFWNLVGDSGENYADARKKLGYERPITGSCPLPSEGHDNQHPSSPGNHNGGGDRVSDGGGVMGDTNSPNPTSAPTGMGAP